MLHRSLGWNLVFRVHAPLLLAVVVADFCAVLYGYRRRRLFLTSPDRVLRNVQSVFSVFSSFGSLLVSSKKTTRQKTANTEHFRLCSFPSIFSTFIWDTTFCCFWGRHRLIGLSSEMLVTVFAFVRLLSESFSNRESSKCSSTYKQSHPNEVVNHWNCYFIPFSVLPNALTNQIYILSSFAESWFSFISDSCKNCRSGPSRWSSKWKGAYFCKVYW